MKKITTFFTIFFILYLICCLFNPVDNTDYSFFRRSNMSLHIDNETGCHYLSGWSAVLTPRLDKNGNHICSGYKGANR